MPTPGSQAFFPNSGFVPQSGKEMETGGKTAPSQVRGRRDDSKGQERYIEIKAPTAPGARSSVPYQQVLPKYKQAAEKAIDRKAIPKEHEKRVKEYFESLEKGG